MELAEQLVELAEVLVIAAETLIKLIAEFIAELINRTELLVKLAGRTELKAQIKIQQPEELEVLLVAVHY